MGHGHRRRTDGGFAVDFGFVLGDDFRIVTDEELAAHRESAEAFALGDVGFLQQGKAGAM